MERAQLAAARKRKHWTLAEVARQLGVDTASVQRWEKGTATPQPLNIRKLEALFGLSARQLGLGDDLPLEDVLPPEESHTPALAAFRQHDVTLRLMRRVWHWSQPGCHELQVSILSELEENTMHIDESLTRRDAVRRLALLPVELFGLSSLGASLTRAPEELLPQCAAGIVACWSLRKGNDLAFADQAVSTYLPTLKTLVQSGPAGQRKSAADLLTQCLLLKSVLAWNASSLAGAITYAQQAEVYSTIADSRLLQVAALRTQSAAYCYAGQWEPALRAAEKAQGLLEQHPTRSPSQPAEAPIAQLLYSYVYAGLATYHAYFGRKDEALRSLRKAHTAFFERSATEQVPLWVDHSVGNLLNNDGSVYLHLGMHKEALTSLTQLETRYGQDPTIPLSCRVASTFDQVITEVSRDDQPRDMDWCIQQWTQGMHGAQTLQSQLRFQEGMQAYTAMRAAWPQEHRIKALREALIHW